MRITAGDILKTAILATFSVVVFALSPAVHALSTNGVSPFQATSSLPLATSDLTSAVYNDYIYQLGGASTQGGSSVTVNFAHINSDGTIGEWAATTPLPNAVYDSSTVIHNGYIYQVGGAPNGGNGSSSTIYYAPLNSDGTVGTWNTTTSLPQQLVGHSTVVNNDYMYVIGGMDTTAGLSNKIYYAPINVNGTIGSWTNGGTVPDYSLEGTAVVNNNRVYVAGGIGSGFSPLADVFIGNLNIDGSVSSWAVSSNPMPTAVVSGSSVVNNNYIYVLGGGASLGAVGDSIYYAEILNDGTIDTWQTSSTTLPNPVEKSSSVVNNGYVYSVGGYSNGHIDDVQFAQFITPANADSDEDGILDTEENDGPNNGDANSDSTADVNQANVASFINPLTEEYQVIATDCERVYSVQVGGESSESADAGFDYPMGISGFRIDCATPGTTANITQMFFGNSGSSNYVLRKWDNGQYTTINGYQLSGELIDDQVVFRVDYQITDGQEYDEDQTENGVIVDPAGLGLPVVATNALSSSSTTTDSSSLAETGENINLAYVAISILIGLPVVVFVLRQKYLS